ncbi:unnamed protein product [Closterium sp. NIES-53]
MASLRVLAFDHEGRPVQIDTWLDDLQLYLQSDSKESVLLFDPASGAATAPPATDDSSTRSQWLTHDTAARLAIRNHLPLAECAHFGQHRTAQALYDAVVARYSSPVTAALGRLLLPYLFRKVSAFTTVEDLFSHLRASDARYHAAVPAEFLDRNPPPPRCFARGTPCPPFFEGCSPSPLAPSYASLAAADVPITEDVGAASASAKRHSSKGKGGRCGGGGSSGDGGGSGSGGGGSSGGGGGGATVGGSGGSSGGGGGSDGSGGSGGGGTGSGGTGARRVGSRSGQRQQQQRRSETPSSQQLLEWFLRGASGGSCPYVIRTGDRAGQTCGRPHTQHRCFSRLDDAWRAQFGDDVELPRLADLLKSRIAIFDLDFHAILSAMYALSVSAEGDCYRCVLPDPGIAAAALGASDYGTLPGTMPAEALHTFALDSGASRWSSLYTLTSEPSQVTASAQVSASGQVAASCSCRLLSHQTLLWHHRLGHPSLPRLRCMHSRLLVSGLPKSLPPLPPSPAPPCLPCVEGRQRAAPHSSSFPLMTAPLQTLHMDVQDLPVPRLHSDRGGEFSSTLLRDFCRGKGILQSFTLPDSPQQNGITERRIGLVMEVARTSMIHAAASHFPVAVCGPFYHPTSLRVFLSQDITFYESVPFYRLFPHRSAPPPPSLLFFALAPPPVDPLPPQGLAPSGVSQVDPLPGPAPVQVAVDSGAARGAVSGGAEPGGAESEGAETGGAEPGGAASEGVESGGMEPLGASSSGGSAGASPGLSPQQLREWFVPRTRLRSGAFGAGGVGVAARAGVTGGTATTGLGGARTRGTGAAGTGGVGGAGAGLLPKSGTIGAGGTVAGGTGVGGPGVGGTGAGGARAFDPGGTVRPRPYFVPLLQQVLGTPPSAALTPPLLCPPPDQSQQPLQSASPLPAPSPCTEQSGSLTERRKPASRPVSPVRTARRVPRSRPPPVPGTHAMTLRPSSIPQRVPLRAPPDSSLPEVPDPESDRARTASPTVSRLLAAAVIYPSFGSAAASALVAELLDFAATCRLDYATTLVAESASANPPSVRGECAIGKDVLEDRQEEFGCLAAAVPRFASMLLAPEGDLDDPDIPTPCPYAEAITGPYSSKWQEAMDAKMASWKSTGTYVDEVPPPGANIVDGMWIFKVKRPLDSPPAFKARYVARGFSQRQGVDYFQTFSPTPKMTTLWVLLHVAAQRDYELHSLDFSTAFLQGILHEEIWLRRPPGFIETTLAALGFAPATVYRSLFLRTDTSLPPFYILVYVDDLVFATADTEALTLVKSELQKRYTCTHVGELRSYLGLRITRDRARRTITLTQSHMVHQVLQRFGFQFSSPQPTPLSTSHSLLAPPSDKSVEPNGLYPELVGCLMYLMTCTQPDLAYPLSLLACYVAPGRYRKVNWDAAKRVLRYLCSMSGMGLVLGGRGPVVLTGHADASWVDDSATQRSSQGYTFSLGSGFLSWRSTRSSSVLSSSCEAEIYAGAMAAHELRWLTYR